MEINHTALVENWNLDDVLQNAETLILGSFNPFNPNGDNPDYYYGRCTNYLWRAMAEITYLNPNYFFNDLENKLNFMIDKKFCFLDVINSINISMVNGNDELINDFAQIKIFTEFSDQVLFTTNTNFQNANITLAREYNESIIPLINNGNIKKIIHTMGNNTISSNFETKWKERNLGVNGFQGFIESIVGLGVNFVPTSFSPSGRAVKVGGQAYKIQLKEWLNEHLSLN